MVFVSIKASTIGLYLWFFTSADTEGYFVNEIKENLRSKAFASDMANAVLPVPGSPTNNKI